MLPPGATAALVGRRAPFGVAVADDDLQVISINASAERLLNIPTGQGAVRGSPSVSWSNQASVRRPCIACCGTSSGAAGVVPGEDPIESTWACREGWNLCAVAEQPPIPESHCDQQGRWCERCWHELRHRSLHAVASGAKPGGPSPRAPTTVIERLQRELANGCRAWGRSARTSPSGEQACPVMRRATRCFDLAETGAGGFWTTLRPLPPPSRAARRTAQLPAANLQPALARDSSRLATGPASTCWTTLCDYSRNHGVVECACWVRTSGGSWRIATTVAASTEDDLEGGC